MMKHKIKLILSSVIILLPVLFGLIFWDRLPEQMVTHWGVDLAPDATSSTLMAVVFLPLMLLALHLICLGITAWDNRSKGQDGKVMHLVFWIMPVISLFVSAITYAFAFGWELNVAAVTAILLGLLLIVTGNYLPKCRQNRTMGIKLSWTVANEENWNATHRFGGKVFVGVGIATLFTVFLPLAAFFWVFMALILIAVGLPTVYSYRFYKRQLATGVRTKEDYKKTPSTKIGLIITAVLVPLILVACLVICFTGNVTVLYDTESMTVKADFYDDISISYDSIESIRYLESDTAAWRQYGFGSPRLDLGLYESEALGRHMRYTYHRCDALVVLTVNGKLLAINGEDTAATKEIYQTLIEKTGGV